MNIISDEEKYFFMTMFNAKKQLIEIDESPKAGFNEKNVILCKWWVHHNIIHFEFLNSNQLFNADVYSQQIQHGNEIIQ